MGGLLLKNHLIGGRVGGSCVDSNITQKMPVAFAMRPNDVPSEQSREVRCDT
jgi:hypothetical protein